MKNKSIFYLLIGGTLILSSLVSKNMWYKRKSNLPNEITENKKGFGEIKETKSEAMDALQFLSTAASFPNKDIPGNAYVHAITWYKQNSHSNLQNRTSQSTTSWQSIGPVNIGGRTLAVALDPTDTATIWLGAASGGLWKSTTGGIGTSAWSYVPLGFPVLGISSIAINPSNHNEMYIGSGEVYSYGSNSQGIADFRPTRGSYGMGLFKSVNGGATWTQSINWTYQQNRGIWDIVINPLKPSTVYAVTTEGVYKSTNSGSTWNLVLNQKMCMDLEMHETDTNIILCGVGNYGSPTQGVYRTINSGTSWAQVTSGLPSTAYQGRITLTKYKNNNDIMYVHICDIYNSIGIYKSTNKGQTWVQQTTQDIGSYQGWYAKGMVIKPGDPNTILAGGAAIFKSTDGGLSFSQNSNYYHSDIHDIIVNPLDPNKVYVITDGGLYRSNNFFTSFYICNGGYSTTQSYIGSISSTDTTVLLSGLQDNATIKYSSNNTWYYVVGGDGCYNAIDHTNDQIQYAAYQYLNVYKDYSQGSNFTNQILTYSASATGGNQSAFLAPYILCYSNTQYIYAGDQGLRRSTNGGNTWSYRGNNPVNNNMFIMAIAASFTNTDSVYFATNPDPSNTMKMFFSANGGNTVTDISTGLPNRYPRRIAVNPHNSKEVYAVFSGFGTGHVFKSTNAGASWTDVSINLPDMPFECVVVDPVDPNFVYVGCDFGVFVSSDKGQTWTSYDNGFPDATMVFDLVISPSDRYLYAFTHGRGIFKRSLSDLGVGIATISKANIDGQLQLFPNPATTEIHIKMVQQPSQEYIAHLYNLEGKEVKTVKLAEDKTMVEIADLPAGSYIVSVRKNGAPYKYASFIKQ